jgi:HlyD family secretion protein
VKNVSVRRGDHVAAGATLAALEDSDAKIAVAQAQAALAEADAQLANLQIGKRPEEIAVLKAAVDMARAQQADAQRKVDRLSDLYQKGTATQADFDTAETTLKTAVAQVEQAEANLAVGKLPARPEEIKAAENQVAQANASLDQARWRLAKRVITAPAAGRINDIIRNPGMWPGRRRR